MTRNYRMVCRLYFYGTYGGAQRTRARPNILVTPTLATARAPPAPLSVALVVQVVPAIVVVPPPRVVLRLEVRVVVPVLLALLLLGVALGGVVVVIPARDALIGRAD
eukprot:7113483-Alexandrium_andersonii.AAC.1